MFSLSLPFILRYLQGFTRWGRKQHCSDTSVLRLIFQCFLSLFNPHSGELSGNGLFIMHRLNGEQTLLVRSCQEVCGCPSHGWPSPVPAVRHWPSPQPGWPGCPTAGLGSAPRLVMEVTTLWVRSFPGFREGGGCFLLSHACRVACWQCAESFEIDWRDGFHVSMYWKNGEIRFQLQGGKAGKSHVRKGLVLLIEV